MKPEIGTLLNARGHRSREDRDTDNGTCGIISSAPKNMIPRRTESEERVNRATTSGRHFPGRLRSPNLRGGGRVMAD